MAVLDMGPAPFRSQIVKVKEEKHKDFLGELRR